MRLFILIFFAFSFTACRKNAIHSVEGNLTDIPSTAKPDTYYPYEIGNYWIYENYTWIPPNPIAGVQIDSVYVRGDTIINGNKYRIVESSVQNRQFFSVRAFVKDSAECTTFYQSGIRLCQRTLRSYFRDGYMLNDDDTLAYYAFRFTNFDSLVVKAAVTFSTVTELGTFSIYPAYQNTAASYPKHNKIIYAKNVGIIYRSADFVSSNGSLVSSILRYKVNR